MFLTTYTYEVPMSLIIYRHFMIIHYFQIPITNILSADTNLKKTELIGKLHLVWIIVILPVKQLKSTENELSCKLKHIEINHQTNANKDLIQKHGIHKERELTNTEDHQKIVNIWKIIWHINLNNWCQTDVGKLVVLPWKFTCKINPNPKKLQQYTRATH